MPTKTKSDPERVYEEDYTTITQALLFEPVTYETAIEALNTVIMSNLFD